MTRVLCWRDDCKYLTDGSVCGCPCISLDEDGECENLPVLVDGKEVGTWDGIVHIFCCGRAKQIILTANGDESDRFLSLDDCLDEIECDKEDEYAIVIIEEGLHGDIYKFGQYSNREWHKCGSTCGFW